MILSNSLASQQGSRGVGATLIQPPVAKARIKCKMQLGLRATLSFMLLASISGRKCDAHIQRHTERHTLVFKNRFDARTRLMQPRSGSFANVTFFSLELADSQMHCLYAFTHAGIWACVTLGLADRVW